MRILLVEDDPVLGDAVFNALKLAGYAVDWVRDGAAAETSLRAQEFDLVLLDLGLPRLGGIEVLQRLRARGPKTPVLIMTAADSVGDRVAGLDAGADDYLVKPFALAELEARVRALIRRTHGADSGELRCGSLSFNVAARRASAGGMPLDLSARELAVLEVLLLRAGQLISKRQMIEHLFNWEEGVSTNAIEVYVHRLRRKLEPHGVDIVTIRGLGYCIEKRAAG